MTASLSPGSSSKRELAATTETVVSNLDRQAESAAMKKSVHYYHIAEFKITCCTGYVKGDTQGRNFCAV